MSKYYNAKRIKNLYNSGSNDSFKLSRYKIELFVNCPRCFYLDVKLGVARPGGFPFSINNAVDKLLKKEFDVHRIKKSKHPFIEEYRIDAIPYNHKNIDDWRNTRKGISYLHKPTNFLIYGGVDDIWINSKKELIIVDYKATSKDGEVGLDEDWQMSYKRQMEIYQWLFRKNNFKVSDTGYFVYCNGNTDKKAFDKKIEFDVKVIPYKGKDDWIEETIKSIYKTLLSDKLPDINPDCDFCSYRKETMKIER